jgi:ubiquinone/menaquinone biosynthesis C-methylase UbiE
MSYTLNFPNQQPLVDRYFDSEAPKWNQLYRVRKLTSIIFSQRLSVALDWLTQSLHLPGCDVLDAGCGAGPASVALAQRGARVSAIDSVQRMVSLTRQNAEEAGLADSVDANVGDVHALRFSEKTFDAVVAIGVLYWLHSPERALSEILRVLKPGGLLVVSADNARRLTYRSDPGHLAPVLAVRRFAGQMLRAVGLRKPASAIRVNRYSPRDFDRMLRNEGFEKLRSTTIGFGPFSIFEWKLIPERIGRTLHDLMQSLADQNHPLLSTAGNHYLVLAKKPL